MAKQDNGDSLEVKCTVQYVRADMVVIAMYILAADHTVPVITDRGNGQCAAPTVSGELGFLGSRAEGTLSVPHTWESCAVCTQA